MIDEVQDILFRLVRSALGTESFAGRLDLSDSQWKELFRLSAGQMVSAMVLDQISALESNIPDHIRLGWQKQVAHAGKHFDSQLLSLNHLAAVLSVEGIDFTVLKGLGLAILYPKPQLRECLDVDIYCGENYERVNDLVLKTGLCKEVFYEEMHSAFNLDGIHIENHYKFTNDFTKALTFNKEVIMGMESEKRVTDPRLPGISFPGVNMGAFHLMSHTISHLSWSGILLRHLCDWTVYVRSYRDSLDWDFLCAQWKLSGLDRMVSLIFDICRKYLSLDFVPEQLVQYRNKREEDYILHNIFHPFKPSAAVKDPFRKAVRKIAQYRYLCRMHRIVFGEKFPLSFRYIITPHPESSVSRSI